MTFPANCLLCIKYQSIVSGENKKQSMRLSSADYAQRVEKVKCMLYKIYPTYLAYMFIYMHEHVG